VKQKGNIPKKQSAQTCCVNSTPEPQSTDRASEPSKALLLREAAEV